MTFLIFLFIILLGMRFSHRKEISFLKPLKSKLMTSAKYAGEVGFFCF